MSPGGLGAPRCALVVVTVAITLLASTVAMANASVDLEVEPLNPQVGEPIRVRYAVMVQNESGVQVQPLDIGSLQALSDMSPPSMPMMWGGGGGGFMMTMQTEQLYTLRATAPGQYVIGNARILNASGRVVAQHPSVTIVVGGVAAPTAAGPTEPSAGYVAPTPTDPDAPPEGDLTGAEYDPNAFLRAGVDVANPYLGQQVILRIWLYVASSEANCEVAHEPTMNGCWNEMLTPLSRDCATRWYTRNVGGRFMTVGLVRKFALFPTQTGRVTIGPAAASVEAMSGNMFRSFVRLEAHSPELQFDVREPPTSGRPADYVPGTVGPVNLTAEADRPEARVGETVTITVHATSGGSLASATVTPPANIDGLRIRTGGARAVHDLATGRVVSNLETEFLVVPDRAGEFDLGEARLSYWDPAASHYGVAQAVLPRIRATGTAATPESTTRLPEPEMELGALVRDVSLRPYQPLFRRGATPVFAIGTAPVLALVGGAMSLSGRAFARRRRARAAERKNDPRAILAAAREALADERGKAVSLAARALDRAIAYARELRADEAFDDATSLAITQARAACDAARFAGDDVDAATVISRVDTAVSALEALE